VSGGIFPETLFLAFLLQLSVPDSRKCLGEPRVNMKWNLNLEKMPPLLKQRITRKFLVKWHSACGGIFRETLFLQNRRGQGENIEQNHYGSYWNIEKVIVTILNLVIVSRRNSIFEADNVNLEDRMTDGSDGDPNSPEPPECLKIRPTFNSNNRMWDPTCNPGMSCYVPVIISYILN